MRALKPSTALTQPEHQGHWDFYLRLARRGYMFACTRQGVMVVRIHRGGAHKNKVAMYSARLEILDTLFGDTALQDVLAPVRSLAYFRTHQSFMRAFYHGSKWENGATALNEAVKLSPLPEEDIRLVSDMLARVALHEQNAANPAARVDKALASIVDQPTKLRLRSAAMVAIDVERTRRAAANRAGSVG